MSNDDGDVRFMPQVISLDYTMRVPPTSAEFGRRLAGRAIWGHRCPRCALVYVPPRGFCPMCVTETTWDDDAVEVADRGIVTSWTVLTPIQYHGQTERADYALASILLDGADGTVGQQRLADVALDNIRLGMRVEAVWADDEDDEDDEAGGRQGYGFGNAVSGWRPTGEPDAPQESYAEHVL